MADTSSPRPLSLSLSISPLPPFKPDLYERAWQSLPHPTLPLLATAHHKSVTVFSLSTLSAHSSLTGGHQRSVRSTTWKPELAPGKLCLVSGSFDATAGLWRWEDPNNSGAGPPGADGDLAVEITRPPGGDDDDASSDSTGEKDWEFTLVLEGHDSEIKSVAFSPTGLYLATCARDKSVWIWEDVGGNEADDEWETVAVLSEHEGDVKAVAWCPNVPGRTEHATLSSDVLASASYDDTIRIWREDEDAEWTCVAVLEGHQGTVWGLQWEPRSRPDQRFPRLLTWSADRTIRIWSIRDDSAAPSDAPQHAWGSGFGSIPNTMRQSRREDWSCTATLPSAHTREIYAASWSADTGRVASAGSDGSIVVYAESDQTTSHEAAAELDGDVHMTNGENSNSPEDGDESQRWSVVGRETNAHGPYEINHITWCKRYDQGCPPDRRGVEEMLVTTGDDGIVRPWQVS